MHCQGESPGGVVTESELSPWVAKHLTDLPEALVMKPEMSEVSTKAKVKQTNKYYNKNNKKQ